MTKSKFKFIHKHHKIAILAALLLVTGFSVFFYLLVLPKIALDANNVPIEPQTQPHAPFSVSGVISSLDTVSGSNVTVIGMYHSLNGFGIGGCVFAAPAGNNIAIPRSNSTDYIAYGLTASPSYFIKDPSSNQLLTIQMVDNNGKPTYVTPNLPENKSLTLSGIIKKTYASDCGSNTIVSHPSAIFYVVSNQLGIDAKTLPTSSVNIPFTQDPSDKVQVLSVTMSPALPQINQTVYFDFKLKNISNSYLLMHASQNCGVQVPTSSLIQFDSSVLSTKTDPFMSYAMCAVFTPANYNYTTIASSPSSTIDIGTDGLPMPHNSHLIVSNYGTTTGHYTISDTMSTAQIQPFSISGTITVTATKSNFISQLSLIPKLCWSC